MCESRSLRAKKKWLHSTYFKRYSQIEGEELTCAVLRLALGKANKYKRL